MQYVSPEQTLTIKGVQKGMLVRIQEDIVREASPKLGLFHVEDKDPSCAGQYLVYANYDSGRDCLAALDKLKRLVDDRWPGRQIQIMRKSEMAAPAFAVYVENAPPGTCKEDMADFFSRFGQLHPCTPVACIKYSDNAFFINFIRFEGAVAVLEAESRKALRFGSSVMKSNAARNTTFINDLITSLLEKGIFSFSLDEALEVREQMSSNHWPPKTSDVAKLVASVPERFVIDRSTKKYHLIDGKASLSPVIFHDSLITTLPEVQVDIPSPEGDICPDEESAQKRRKRAVYDLVHDNFELLHELFKWLWREAKGRSWKDSEGGFMSTSAVELQEELNKQELPPTMMNPVGDWDLSSLCTALMATSLKAKLDEISPRSSPRGEYQDSGRVQSRFMVLVKDKIITLEDLEGKYALCFEAAKKRAPQALQSIRFVRNILCHQKGSVKGLSEESFHSLWSVVTEAFGTLARVLRSSHPDAVRRFHERCGKILESVRGVQRCTSLDGSRSPCLGSPSSSSSSPITSDAEADADVKDWIKDSKDGSESDRVAAGLMTWRQDQVVRLFKRCGFPTEGIEAGKIDGRSLLELYTADDAMELFTAPVPDGLGLNRLMFRGRFKIEMAKLLCEGDATNTGNPKGTRCAGGFVTGLFQGRSRTA